MVDSNNQVAAGSHRDFRILVLMPSYKDLATGASVLNQIRDGAPPGVTVSGVLIDESLGTDSGRVKLNPLDSVIQFPYRMGSQSVMSRAIRNVLPKLDWDWLVTMDSDGEDRASDVWNLWSCRDSDTDVVLGERSQRHSSLGFKLGYSSFKIIFRLATGLSLKTGGFACLRRGWVISNRNRAEFAFSFAGALCALPANRRSVPCIRDPRQHGRTRMRLIDSTKDAIRMLIPQSGLIASRSLVFVIFMCFLALLSLVYIGAVNALGFASPGWTTSALTLVMAGALSAVLLFLVAAIMYSLVLLGTVILESRELTSDDL